MTGSRAGAAGDDDALDVSFDALDMAGVEDGGFGGTGGTPLSEPGGDGLRIDGFSPPKDGMSDLFATGRTGLTPSGPIAKTPAGGCARGVGESLALGGDPSPRERDPSGRLR